MPKQTLFVLTCWLLCALGAAAQEPLRIGKGVIPPRLIHRVEPQYSEEARKAKLNGTVALYVAVRPDGRAGDMRVIRSLGLGLDERAVAAVGQWEFQPGEKDGQPVSVAATVEVNFRLLPGRGMEPGWYLKRASFQLPEGALRPVITKSPYLRATQTAPASATVELAIDEQGFVSAVRLQNSSDPDSGAEALAIVREWQFSPAMRNSDPFAVTATFELVFGSIETPPAGTRPRTTL